VSVPDTEAQSAFGAPAPPRKPTGLLGYVLAAVIAPLAILGAIGWFISGFSSLDDKVTALQRIPIPGQKVVTLEDGSQSIYFESADGEDVAVPRLKIEVRPVGGGSAVELHKPGTDVQYSLSGYNGQLIRGFDTEHAGRYTVRVAPNDAVLPSAPALAVGKGVGHHIVVTVVGGLAIGFLGLLLAAVIFAVTYTRRRRAKQRP
jgi:hypothetical protein